MSLFARIERLVKANLNHLLDKVEDPERTLEQRIKEIEAAMAEAKEAAAGFAVTLKQTEREHDRAARLRDEWTAKAERCLRAGDEDAAKRALRERLRSKERADALLPRVEHSRQAYAKLKESLHKLQEQLSDCRTKLSQLSARRRAADAQQTFGRQYDKAHGAALGDGEFARLEDEVLQKESEVEVAQEIRGEFLGDDADERTRELEVESELEELKKKLRNSGT